MQLSQVARNSLRAALRNQGAATEIIATLAGSKRRGKEWFVYPDGGSDRNSGKNWTEAFASMSPLDDLLGHGDTIYLSGVLRQHWTTAPYKNDVSIIGVENQPRQATSGGVANGAGATWLSPTSVTNTSPLVKVFLQGWRFENIFFNNAATTAPSILLYRDGEAVEADASHAQIVGCVFNGTDDGIQASGGPNYVTIRDCRFHGFGGSGDTAISNTTGAGIGVNHGWLIENNVFFDNTNHVVVPLVNGTVRRNNFIVVGNTTTATIALSLTGGSGNSVYENMFNRPVNTSPNATLYVGGTNDVWSQNYGSDNIFFGVPDNS